VKPAATVGALLLVVACCAAPFVVVAAASISLASLVAMLRAYGEFTAAMLVIALGLIFAAVRVVKARTKPTRLNSKTQTVSASDVGREPVSVLGGELHEQDT
jgi:membrane protein implicated in regulation of membrane protease activity